MTRLNIGSRAQVMHGTAKQTSGGLTKSKLKYNKRGRIVSRKASQLAKKNNRLVKAGYITKKGQFGIIKRGGMIAAIRYKKLEEQKAREALEEQKAREALEALEAPEEQQNINQEAQRKKNQEREERIKQQINITKILKNIGFIKKEFLHGERQYIEKIKELRRELKKFSSRIVILLNNIKIHFINFKKRKKKKKKYLYGVIIDKIKILDNILENILGLHEKFYTQLDNVNCQDIYCLKTDICINYDEKKNVDKINNYIVNYVDYAFHLKGMNDFYYNDFKDINDFPDLGSLLILPIQRITRWKLFFVDIIKQFTKLTEINPKFTKLNKINPKGNYTQNLDKCGKSLIFIKKILDKVNGKKK